MRRMLFATFVLPNTRQFVELAHPHFSFTSCGIVRIMASLYNDHGAQLAASELPLDDIVIDLAHAFPSVTTSALATFDVTYDLKGKKHPYQYGFLYQDLPGATHIHYPLDAALGITDAINYYPNHGYFPVMALPPWIGLRLYLGNVSEHAPLTSHVRIVRAKHDESFNITLPPLGHQVVDLPSSVTDEAIRYLIVSGETKPVCYVAGVNRRNGGLAFLEHLMQTAKLDEPVLPSGKVTHAA